MNVNLTFFLFQKLKLKLLILFKIYHVSNLLKKIYLLRNFRKWINIEFQQDLRQMKMIREEDNLTDQIKKKQDPIQTTNIEENVKQNIFPKSSQEEFQQNLQQLEDKFGIKKIDKNSQTFKDLQYYLTDLLQYPNSSLAKLHRQANKLGSFDRSNNDNQIQQSKLKNQQKTRQNNEFTYCSCCGLIRQTQQLNICSDSFKQTTHLGISVYMFFNFIKIIIYMMLLALVVFGLFAFATNIKSANQIQQYHILNQNQFPDILRISLGSKIYIYSTQSDYLIAQVWLGVALVIIQIGAYFFLQWRQVFQIKKLEQEYINVSNNSIQINGVPENATKEEIEFAINQLWKQYTNSKDEYIKIVKINMGITFGLKLDPKIYNKQRWSLYRNIENHIKYQQTIISWIKQLRYQNQFKTSPQQRKIIIQLYHQNTQQRERIYHKIVDIVKKTFQQQKKRQILTDFFVTFQSKNQKSKFLEALQPGLFGKLLQYLTFYNYKKTHNLKINDQQQYKVKIQQASQPEDIIWKNIGINFWFPLPWKIFKTSFTLFILGGSFVTIYGLSGIQVQNQNSRFTSIFISLCMLIYNQMILFYLYSVAFVEYNVTKTNFQSSLAVKVIICTMLNQIAVPILINMFIKNTQFIYIKSGLSDDIFYFGLINAFITPILRMIDPSFIIVKWFLVWYKDRPQKKLFLNQFDLNKIYQLKSFQSGTQYAYIIVTYLFTCFFMPLQPIILFFSIVGMILYYWAQKCSLYHRRKRPSPGTRILYDTIIKFIYLGGLMYAIGSIVFINSIPADIFKKNINSALIGNVIAILLGIVSIFLPYSKKFKNITDQKDHLYSQNCISYLSQYDRFNPATRQQAIKQYLKFIKIKKEQVINKNTAEHRSLSILQNIARNNYMMNYDQANLLNLRPKPLDEVRDCVKNPRVYMNKLVRQNILTIDDSNYLNELINNYTTEQRKNAIPESAQQQNKKQQKVLFFKILNYFKDNKDKSNPSSSTQNNQNSQSKIIEQVDNDANNLPKQTGNRMNIKEDNMI